MQTVLGDWMKEEMVQSAQHGYASIPPVLVSHPVDVIGPK